VEKKNIISIAPEVPVDEIVTKSVVKFQVIVAMFQGYEKAIES